DGITRVTTLRFSGVTEPNALVFLTDAFDGTGLGVVADEVGAWSFELTGLAEGLHRLSAVAYDWAGNPSGTSVLDVTIDTTPPAATLLDLVPADDSGRFQDDNVTNAPTWTFTGITDPRALVTLLAGAETR